MDDLRDVIIVGGGAAGLSAALVLARSLREVEVIDAGEPRNASAAGAHNVFGRDGESPRELLSIAAEQAAGYGARVTRDRVVAGRIGTDAVEVELAGGRTVRGRRVLLATGVRDALPPIPGVAELWGRDVVHCPYCHGFEVRGRRLVVVGMSERSVHQALLFARLADGAVFVTHDAPAPDADQRRDLEALGVRIVEGRVDRLAVEDGGVRAVVLADGGELPAGAVALGAPTHPRAELYLELGGELVEQPGAGLVVPIDATGRTPLPRVWAAGNLTDHGATVAASAAAGVQSGAVLNFDLLSEELAAARR